MLDREPFLKAIFATPDDDLPRLVFADYLQETGDEEWASRIRQECEAAHTSPPEPIGLNPSIRGFSPPSRIEITEEFLNDPNKLRFHACSKRPEWYGSTSLKILSGKITTQAMLHNVLANPVTEHVKELDFSGAVFEQKVTTESDDSGYPLYDLVIHAVITVPMVEHMAQMREVRRLTRLYLNDNDLDNDAARALARSPHLFRLEQLRIYQGSRFKARTWQLLVERFGEHVVE
jgi:uncharacterized protein (TIGR02996 family)